jgi:hypothetical protein
MSAPRRPLASPPPSRRPRSQRRVDSNLNPASAAFLPQSIPERRLRRGGSRSNAGRRQQRERLPTLRPEDEGFIPQAFRAQYHNLTDTQKYHRMGAMVEECSHCHALFWKEEVNFMNCCKRGEIVLFLLSEPPDLLKRLLTYDYLDSNSFFQHIRQYNSALAFTSVAYTPDRRLGTHAYNTNLSQSLLRELDAMIRQFNPHYRIFQTAREILSETSNS